MEASRHDRAFTVYNSPSGDEVFPEGSTFKVQDNGVLTTTTFDGRRRINSPNACQPRGSAGIATSTEASSEDRGAVVCHARWH
jgi:hypothetical protein